MDSQGDAPKPLNVLCLDGGGVRGLSSLYVLKVLMEALQHKLNTDDTPRPCDIFDLICGTSTGGLIALMLGRLRMTVQEAITYYRDFSEKVFKDTLSYPRWRLLRGKAMYDASILEERIKDICSKHTDSKKAPLRDPRDKQDGFCRVFVVAATRAHADAAPKLFRSYSTKQQMADRCAIWEAARATTAAPTFFDPMAIGDPPITYVVSF
jgi:patatin-like phospholipase/acyl hydrolase